MKAKTIKAVLNKKINEWVESIDNPEVQKLAKKHTIVTGGCIASMLLGEKVNDFDIYFRNKETALAITEYYINKFKQNSPTKFRANQTEVPIWYEIDNSGRIKIVIKSAGIAAETGSEDYQYFEGLPNDATDATEYVDNTMSVVNALEDDEKPKYRPVFISANAITLSNKIQAAIRFYGEPDEIHKNYDFAHCMNYWDSSSGKLVLKPDALEALLARELRYVGSLYPLCSIIRTRKFIRRGWTITAGQYLKMVMQLNKLDLTNLDVLENQLTGVDTAYFNEIINKLREKGDKVDYAYLVEIIDRMF